MGFFFFSLFSISKLLNSRCVTKSLPKIIKEEVPEKFFNHRKEKIKAHFEQKRTDVHHRYL